MGRIEIISASAGSGKTYTLAQILSKEISEGRVRPEAVIATTFTNRAAAELHERARSRLLQDGLFDQAQLIMAARFGTVNALCGRLLSEFAFELGFAHDLRVLEDSRVKQLIKSALAQVGSAEEQNKLNALMQRWEHLQADTRAKRDWSNLVQGVLDKTRVNRIQPESMPQFAQRSLEGFTNLVESPLRSPDQLDKAFRADFKTFVDDVAAAGDKTKTTKNVIEIARKILNGLDSGQGQKWSQWVKLENSKTAKKSEHLQAGLHATARQHLADPRFLQDAQDIIELIMALSQNGLQSYAQTKRQSGYIDFVDQEVYALSLLESEAVLNRLRGKIDLVLVDEFQDTSPLELAIFLKLADLSKRSIWVGDQKQSIYGFRGTDPALMESALETILEDAEPQTLEHSYRSRPDLVRLTSEIFASAFSSQGLPPKRVKLEPCNDEEPASLGPIMERWIIQGKNKSMAAGSIATGVAHLLQTDPATVREKNTKSSRDAKPGDIAVLCRTNSECDLVAEALEDVGLKAARPRAGLFFTHEGCLMLAGIRLWVDPQDKLAQAELLRLIDYPDEPKTWLEETLVNSECSENPSIADLLAARELNILASPVTVFDQVAEALHARSLCLSWGKAKERLFNLGAMRELVVSYVKDFCTVEQAPNLAGMLAHFEGLRSNAEDQQATLLDDQAVQVLTWHAAKGLEWPIVIMHGIDKFDDADPFGIYIESELDRIDLSNPLKGRWIRYWPRPYHPNQSNSELFNRAGSLPETYVARDQANAERLRLLYVTWTRARDRLVLPAVEGKLTTGLLRLLNITANNVSDLEVEKSFVGLVPTTWAGYPFELMVRRFAPTEPVKVQSQAGQGYLAQGPKVHPPAWESPSERSDGGFAGDPIVIGKRIQIQGAPVMADLGHAVHGFLAADREDLSPDERYKLAQGLVSRWKVKESIDPHGLISAGKRFRQWVHEQWPNCRWHREIPLMQRLEGGTQLRGICDMALELEDEFVVIDHKSFPGTQSDAKQRAMQYAAQLMAYAKGIEAATNKKVEACYIHLPLLGLVVPVGFAADQLSFGF